MLASVARAAAYLEAHDDYAYAHGSYIGFFVDAAKQFRWQPIYGHQSLVSEKPLERMRRHVGNYFPTHFALMRSSYAQKAYGALVDNNIDPLLWGELMPSFLMPLFGKAKVLPLLWAVRDTYSSGRSTWPTLQQFQAQGLYREKYESMRAACLPLITHAAKVSESAAGDAMDEMLELYIAQLHKKRQHAVAQLFARIRSRIKKEVFRLRYGNDIDAIRTIVQM